MIQTRLARRTFLSVLLASAVAPSAFARDDRPALFLIGDSIIRNGYNDNGGTNGQWGWGHMVKFHFDTSRIHVVNDAMGGTSSESYMTSPGLWGLVKPLIRPGDFVMIGFGHNDSYGAAPGNDDELHPKREIPPRDGSEPLPPTGELVHSFGWYLREYVRQIRALGATPILMSLIPRNAWTDAGEIRRSENSYALWTRQAAEQADAHFIPLNRLVCDRFDALGQTHVTENLFPEGEYVHPNWTGAVMIADIVMGALKELATPLNTYMVASPDVPAIPDVEHPAVGDLGPPERLPESRR